MTDENLTWKTHVELVENKISKNVKNLCMDEIMQNIYFAGI